MFFRRTHACIACGWLACSLGCTTLQTSDTARTAMEQLLISNAVDQSLDKIAFEALAGQKVFLDAQHLECVDKGYIVGSVRHRSLAAGAQLVDKAENADLVVEIRSGGVGTNHEDSFVGIPGITMPAPIPIALPDVKFFARETQTATAKIGLVAYDAKSKQAVGVGGLTMASADDNNWSFFGIGPFYDGSVRDEVDAATGDGALSGDLSRVAQQRGYRNSMGEINRVALVNGTTAPPVVEQNEVRRTARAEKSNPPVGAPAAPVQPPINPSPPIAAPPAGPPLPPAANIYGPPPATYPTYPTNPSYPGPPVSSWPSQPVR